MENLSVGNIILITAFVTELFTLAILILTKTETILIAVEKIKGVIGLAYKDRAKRSDDEIRLYKKHEQVARERIRHSFVTMEKWNTKWIWNWDKNLQPINIKGYCTGNVDEVISRYKYVCNHPVAPYFLERTEAEKKTHFSQLAIFCLNHNGEFPHKTIRENFNVYHDSMSGRMADEVFNEMLSKDIIAQRDLLIAEEIIKIKRQFWR